MNLTSCHRHFFLCPPLAQVVRHGLFTVRAAAPHRAPDRKIESGPITFDVNTCDGPPKVTFPTFPHSYHWHSCHHVTPAEHGEKELEHELEAQRGSCKLLHVDRMTALDAGTGCHANPAQMRAR